MAIEASRTVIGSTDKGQVVVIEKQFYDDYERPQVSFEVRHGVRTVDSGLIKAKADALAKALLHVEAPRQPVSEEVSEADATHRRAVAQRALP